MSANSGNTRAGSVRVGGIALGLALVGLLVGGVPWLSPSAAYCPSTGAWSLHDRTPALEGLYAPGSIQAWGSNATDLMVGGNGFFNNVGTVNWSTPRLLDFPLAPSGWSDPRNVTGTILPWFSGGGVFGQVWNGSSWLFSGFREVDSRSDPALILEAHGSVTDLSGRVAAAFSGQGIWAAAWNGSAFLLGGNSSGSATLVVLWANGTFQDLSGSLPRPTPGDWIQLLAWNGAEWIVGGQGVFGTLHGTRFTDLYPDSAYTPGGVFAAGWNGSAWLVSGTPTVLTAVAGDRLGPAPNLAPGFNAWVGSILPAGPYWVVAGGGWAAPDRYGGAGSPYVPTLEIVAPGGCSVDLSSSMPASFAGGYVQFAAPAPGVVGNSGPWLLVGEGGASPVTLTADGAIAELEVAGLNSSDGGP